MRRVIFSIYDDIEHIQDRWHTNSYQVHQIQNYWDLLMANKKEYAESIGVEFKFYHNTMKDFEINAGFEFARVNLYKHHIMAELAEEYDEVMYVDVDVVFNTKENIFEELDLSKGIHIKEQTSSVLDKNIQKLLLKEVGQRSPTIKYHITKDLLNGADNHVMNTGIMIANSETIRSIRYYDRTFEASEKIRTIKENNYKRDDFSLLRDYYYPNNESIFSYILENHNIPYVLMDEEWHTIIQDPREIDWDKIKIAHFINKKFNAYWKNTQNCIYSIYIEIPDDKLDNPRGHSDDPVNKSLRTKQRLMKYKDRLIQNHKDYAKAVGAKYINFGYDDQYKEFAQRFPDLSEYDIINLYKVWLLDQLTYDYDLVLYIDYDVVFHNYINAFDFLSAEMKLCCDAVEPIDAKVFPNQAGYFEHYNKDFRNPQAKYWNAHALLQEDDIDGDHFIFNTGVMMASRQVMEKLDYFSDIKKVIETMKELKEFSMYPEKVQDSFGYDNETIMSYKVKKNQVPLQRLPRAWHNKHDRHDIKSYDIGSTAWKSAKTGLKSDCKEHNAVMTHFISKNFSLFFGE